MKAELYKRLFRAIFSEDVSSLKKIAITIIQEERKLGHNILADSLEKITITEKDCILLFSNFLYDQDETILEFNNYLIDLIGAKNGF